MPGSDGRTFNVRYYKCNQWGHYASSCTEEPRKISGCKIGMVSDPEPAFLVSLRGKTIRFFNGRDGMNHCNARYLESLEPSNNNATYSIMNVLLGQGITFLGNIANKYSKKEKRLVAATRYL